MDGKAEVKRLEENMVSDLNKIVLKKREIDPNWKRMKREEIQNRDSG